MGKAKKAAKTASKKKPVVKSVKSKSAKAAKSAKVVKPKAKAALPKAVAGKASKAPSKPAVVKAARKVAAKAAGKSTKPAPVKEASAAAKSKNFPLRPEPKLKAKEGKEKKPSVEAEIIESVEPEVIEEIVLTDAEGRRYCRLKDCDQLAVVETYCRYHYLLFWKRIQVRKKILTEGKLERYVEELTARYPDKFLDMLRKDLRSEKEFVAAIQELEIDESQGENDFEEESENFIEEVRGVSSDAAASSSSDDDF